MTQTSPQKNPRNLKTQNNNLPKVDKSSFSGNLTRNKSTVKSKGWLANKNLQFKTTLVGILIGTLPVLLVGAVTSLVVSNSLENQIERQERNIVQSLLQEINLLMGEKHKDIQVMANLDMFTNTQTATTRAEKDALLNRLIEVYQVYDSIAVFDNRGDVVAQNKGTPLSNHLDRVYIQDAKKQNGAVISEPLISTTEGTFNIYLASVIKDSRTGRPIGFVRARLPVRNVKSTIDNFFAQEVNYYLASKDGNIFLSNEREYVKTVLTTGEETQNTGEAYESISVSEVFPKIEDISEIQDIGTITSKNSIQQEKQFLAYGTLTPDYSTQRYSAIVAQDTKEVYEPIRRLNQTIFLGTLLAAGLAGWVAYLLSKKLTKPILKAARTIEKITEGDLDAYIEVEGNDEIATLSEDINDMTTQIKALVQEQQLFAVQSGLLKNITMRLTEALQTSAVFDVAVNEIRSALQTDRVVVYQFDENWEGTIIAESVDDKYPRALGAKIFDPCFAEKFIQKYREGRVQAVPNIYEAGLTDCHLKQLEPFAVKANLVAPIIADGNLLGLLVTHQCIAPRNWEKTEIEFFSQMATQIGPALERTMLLENQQLDSLLALALKNTSFKIAESLNQEKVFDVAIKETRNAINADRVIIYRFDQDWKGTIIAESVDSKYPQSLGATIKDPCFAEKYVDKYRQGRVQATNNIYTAGLTKCHLEQLEPFEVKANLVTPIILEGKLLGLLIVHQCSGPRKWLKAECDFTSQIATQIGPALERISLLKKQQQSEKEQRQAREVMQQRALELLMQVDPVSQGDLTIRAQVTEDEIGTIADSYNATIESLRKIVTQVKGASLEVTKVTTDQEEFIGTLATESMRQAEDIGQALDRIQSLAHSARMVLSNAEQAEEAVKLANRSVEEGEMAMNRTVDGILAIRETVAETAKKVKRLGESTQKISKVVNLISSFADQTNLLALNASIEAAHAGEEGRGFAVVAEEVRSLARQSAEATAEIEKVVAEIQEETNEVVKAMETGTEQVVEGTKMVEETRSSLNQITSASAQINQLVTAIAEAAAEQSQTSEEITETMSDVATISNETSVAVGQVSASFQKLLEVAHQLQSTVSMFKV